MVCVVALPSQAGSVSMLVGSKSGVLSVLSALSVSRGMHFDWLSNQGPSISGTRYSQHCFICFAVLERIMDENSF